LIDKWNLIFDQESAQMQYLKFRSIPGNKEDVIQIHKDIIRTFPEVKYFSRKDGPGLSKLSILLKTWCNYKKDLGFY